jgi:putative DNA primase/helicase
MNYANYDDVVAQLQSAGLLLDSVKKSSGGMQEGKLVVESSRSVRCDVDGEKKKQSGAYWLHELRLDDGVWLTGAYWVDHGNASFKIELRKTCAKCGTDMPLNAAECISPGCGSKKSKARVIPPEQLAAHKARMEEARRQAEAQAAADAERAAAWADAVWLKSHEVTSVDEHDYLSRKMLKAAYGARIFDSNHGVILEGADADDYKYLAQFHGALVVPMLDKSGRRRGLQFILSRLNHQELITRRERDKEYWPKGMLKEGLHYLIGGQMHGVGLVGEGFATAAILHEASNLPVAVAFDANNLGPVGDLLWKQSKKRTKLLYCADDDWLQRCRECKKYTPAAAPVCRHCGKQHGKNNAGVTRAKEAAITTSGAWVMPVFSTARPDDKKGPTDFNDLRCMEGEQLVVAQLQEKLAALEWSFPIAGLNASSPQQGGGGGNGRRAAVSVMSLDDAVMRFMPLDDGTGKYLFDTWTNKVAMRDQMIAILPAGVRADDIKRHPVWMQRGACYLDQVGFDPSGNDKNVLLNTWRGWPMEPQQGSCDKLLSTLQYLCSGEQNHRELFRWVLCWMAYPLQNPGAKMASAIILHGPQGTGKSAVFQALAKIYGDYSTILNQRGLEDKFNSDWADSKLFILAEEVVTRAEMWHIKNELKELVTGEWIRVNPKNIAAYRQRNQVNIAYLSNENQPLPIENDDRRHCVIWTPPQLDEEFYDALWREIDNGGIPAFYHYLLNLDLGDFHPKKRPPMTQAKQNLINLSLPSESRFIAEWIGGDTPWPVVPCASMDLYKAYLKWCKDNGETRPRPSHQFLGTVGNMLGWEKRKARVYPDLNFRGKTGQKWMVIPPAAILQPLGKEQSPDIPAAEWLTEGMFEFKNAGENDEN